MHYLYIKYGSITMLSFGCFWSLSLDPFYQGSLCGLIWTLEGNFGGTFV